MSKIITNRHVYGAIVKNLAWTTDKSKAVQILDVFNLD